MDTVVKYLISLFRRITWDNIIAGCVFAIVATPLLWSLGLTPMRAVLAMIIIFIADRCGDITAEIAKAVRSARQTH